MRSVSVDVGKRKLGIAAVSIDPEKLERARELAKWRWVCLDGTEEGVQVEDEVSALERVLRECNPFVIEVAECINLLSDEEWTPTPGKRSKKIPKRTKGVSKQDALHTFRNAVLKRRDTLLTPWPSLFVVETQSGIATREFQLMDYGICGFFIGLNADRDECKVISNSGSGKGVVARALMNTVGGDASSCAWESYEIALATKGPRVPKPTFVGTEYMHQPALSDDVLKSMDGREATFFGTKASLKEKSKPLDVRIRSRTTQLVRNSGGTLRPEIARKIAREELTDESASASKKKGRRRPSRSAAQGNRMSNKLLVVTAMGVWKDQNLPTGNERGPQCGKWTTEWEKIEKHSRAEERSSRYDFSDAAFQGIYSLWCEYVRPKSKPSATAARRRKLFASTFAPSI